MSLMQREKELSLLTLERTIADLKSSILLFDQFEIGYRQLLEVFVYEWSQFLDGSGRYLTIDGRPPDPSVVTEEIKAMMFPDIIETRAKCNDVKTLFRVVDAVGWSVFTEVVAFRRIIGDAGISGLVQWCGDNLIVRIKRG